MEITTAEKPEQLRRQELQAFVKARELEILTLAALGLTAHATAERMNISRRTVESILARLRKRHEAGSTPYLVAKAQRLGIIPPPDFPKRRRT